MTDRMSDERLAHLLKLQEAVVEAAHVSPHPLSKETITRGELLAECRRAREAEGKWREQYEHFEAQVGPLTRERDALRAAARAVKGEAAEPGTAMNSSALRNAINALAALLPEER